MDNEKLRLSTKVAFGTGEFANSLGFVAFLSFGLYFLTDIVGISPAIAGTIMAVGSVVNAIGGPVVGVLSDNSKSKFGRRRPFILASVLPLGLCTWLVFTDPGFDSKGTTTLYFMIIMMVFYIAICMLDVPYTSLGAEMTKDYDERTSLNFWRSVFSLIAGVIAGALPISIAYALGGIVGSDSKGWSLMGLIFGIATMLFIMICWRGTRGQEKYKEESDHFKFTDILQTFKNRPFLYIIAFYSAGIAAYTVGMCVQVYYLTSYAQMSENQTTIILLAFNIAAILWLPLIPVVSKKFSKQAAWLVMFGIWTISLLLIFFFVHPGDLIKLCIFNVIGGAGSMVAYTVGWAILPDCIEVDEFKTGKRREGLYYGVLTIVQKCSAAIITWIASLCLELIHYDETAAVQSAFTLEGIRFMFSFGVILFILISFYFVIRYPLSRERHRKLRKAIEQKNNGEEPDVEGLERVLIK